MTEWALVPFDEVIDFKEGPGIMARDFRSDGVPLVRLAGLTGSNLLTGCNYLDTEMVHKRWSHFRLARGDVLLSTSASLGRVAVVRDEGAGSIPYTGIIRMRPIDPRVLDADFIPWLLRSPHFAAQVEAAGVGSVMAHFGPSHLRRMSLQLPPREEQHLIARVLDALNDLIDIDRRLIDELTSLRNAEFVFVGERAQDSACFGEIAQLVRESVDASEIAAGSHYLGLEHFGTEGGGIQSVGTGEALDSSKSRFSAGDVLYGKLRPYFRKFDRPGFDGVCSTEIWVLRPKMGFGPGMLHSVVSMPEFTDFAMQGSGGTRMPRANWKHVAGFRVNVPTEGDRIAYEGRADAYWKQINGLRDEIEDLTTTRDQLVPLLLSGQVRVSEVEGVVAS